MYKPPVIRARVLKETTVSGAERFRIVKPNEIVELSAEKFEEYVSLGLVAKTPVPPKKAVEAPAGETAKDSAGNPITTR